MKRKFMILLATIILFLFTCEKDPSSTSTKKLPSISPLNIVIGTKIKMFDNIPEGSCRIVFNNVNDWVRTDSIIDDTIFTMVPFSATSGDVNLHFRNDTIKIENFIISEESPDTVKMCWSDLNYTIDKPMSVYQYMTVINEFKWSVNVVKDTIKISASFCPGDFYVDHHLNLLDNGSNKLPKLISGYSIHYTDYGEVFNKPLKKGIIKIQDWDTKKVISGRIFTTPWNENNYCFWYDFNE